MRLRADKVGLFEPADAGLPTAHRVGNCRIYGDQPVTSLHIS